MGTRLNLKTYLMILAVMPAMVCGVAAAGTIYVDADAQAGGNGQSWATAYKYLQDGLADANNSRKPIEIRVAEGIYMPDEGANQVAGEREAAFELISGVAIKGGYAGIGWPNPDERDIEVFETILSGDLNGNDVIVNEPCDLVTEPTRADNSYSLVTGIGTDWTAVIEGFTITGGNASQSTFTYPYIHGPNSHGGGMYLEDSNSIVSECLFTYNSALMEGGGLHSFHSSPSVVQCKFAANYSRGDGGGLWHEYGSGIVSSCKFIGNGARDDAGGVYFSEGGSPTLEYCEITENAAGDDGGGIYCSKDCGLLITGNVITHNVAFNGGGIGCRKRGRPKIVDNLIAANRAIDDGGGMYLRDSGCDVRANVIRENYAGDDGGAMFLKTAWYYPVQVADSNLVDNVIVANIALDNGGGIYCQNVSPNITNCLIVLNFADDGAGIWCRVKPAPASDSEVMVENELESAPVISNVTISGNVATEVGGGICCRWSSSPTLADSILWGNIAALGPQIAVLDDAQIVVRSSDVEGGWLGTGNMNADPCFVDQGYRYNNGTPLDPNDDTYTEGDYHLKSQAGHWDAVAQSWIEDDVTSPCIDAGDPNTSIGWEPYPNGGRVNMGAYGGTEEASKSYFGRPVCRKPIAGDVNGDCVVDFRDFAIMAFHWLEDNRE